MSIELKLILQFFFNRAGPLWNSGCRRTEPRRRVALAKRAALKISVSPLNSIGRSRQPSSFPARWYAWAREHPRWRSSGLTCTGRRTAPISRRRDRICGRLGAGEAHHMMSGCQRDSFSTKLSRSRHFTARMDQFQDHAFSCTFVQLHNLPASPVGLHEIRLTNIFLQFFEGEHRVLPGI